MARAETPANGPPPRTRREIVLKWVVAITAVLSLGFGLNQAVQLISDGRERQRSIAELYRVGKQQQSSADFGGAWTSLEQALKTAEAGGRISKLIGQLSQERREVRMAQEDLAMEWLQYSRLSGGQTFAEFVEKPLAVIQRGAASASGPRNADLLAHVGWATFLRSRSGQSDLDPEPLYRQAIEADSANPYAHVFWGHWLLWQKRELEAALQHFSAAIAAGRARDQVRKIQLAALKNASESGEGDYLVAVNDMRRNNETISSQTRSDLFSIYTLTCAQRYDVERWTALLTALAAADQLITFQSLFYGAHDNDFDRWKRLGRDACLATLLEAAGQREEALKAWVTVRQNLPVQSGNLNLRAHAAIARLSR